MALDMNIIWDYNLTHKEERAHEKYYFNLFCFISFILWGDGNWAKSGYYNTQ